MFLQRHLLVWHLELADTQSKVHPKVLNLLSSLDTLSPGENFGCFRSLGDRTAEVPAALGFRLFLMCGEQVIGDRRMAGAIFN